jgi:RNA polymerase sigma factor (sigma-70 family)
MDDALLASRAMAGDLDSFGQLYDRYFHRVYDFAWRIVRDGDEAASVTQDVFMAALQELGGLQKAASFKSWLFTIAHNTAVARAERAGQTAPPTPAHEEAFGRFDVPDPSELDDPEIVGGDHELAALVWEAVAALNPRDYAVLDLHVRQGLDSGEIAGVMGVSKGAAYTMVSRMKTAAADVIGSYVVARRGAGDCEGLRETLAAFEFPPYSEEVRRAVDGHIRSCERCREARSRLVAPLAIFGGFVAVPAPLALKGEIWRNVAGAWNTLGPASGAAAGAPGERLPASPYGDGMVAAAAAGGSGSGSILFAPPGEGGFDRRNLLWFAAAAAGLLVFAFVFGAVIANALGGDDDGGDGLGATEMTRTAEAEMTPGGETTPGATRTVGVAIDTPTPNLTPQATDTPAPTETPAQADPTSTPVAPPTSTPASDDDPTETPIAGTPTRRPSGIPTVTPTPCPPDGCPPPGEATP